MHPLLGPDRHTDDAGLSHAGDPIEDALDVFRKDVQPFRRDDHFLLTAADVELPVGAEHADVAGVEPSVLERAGRFFTRVEVPFRHVVAAHENLAVRRNFHFHACDRLAHGPFLRLERVIQRDDGRRFGQAIALDDHVSELAPERFEIAVERRGADDERPELPAEHAVDLAVLPPADQEMSPARLNRTAPLTAKATVVRRSLWRRRKGSRDHIFAQHVEDLRHGHEHRNASRFDLRNDVDRAVAAHEDDHAGNHRRNERGHRLTEHVAERQQVQKAQRIEGSSPFPMFVNLALHRNDVRQDVAVRDDDAFRLRRRT